MLEDLWLTSPLTAPPQCSNEPGCRYLACLSAVYQLSEWNQSQQSEGSHKHVGQKVSVFNQTQRILRLCCANIPTMEAVIVLTIPGTTSAECHLYVSSMTCYLSVKASHSSNLNDDDSRTRHSSTHSLSVCMVEQYGERHCVC